jgi:Tol biopolymer transport system component
MPLAKGSDGKREPRKLTAVTATFRRLTGSPDGRRIVFSHVASPVVDHWPSGDLSIVDVASGNVTAFATTAAAETSPRFSRDGRWIAATVSELPVRWAQSNRIAIYPAGGGEPRVMPLSHDGQPNIIDWTPDGAKIMFFEPKGTGTSLYEVDVAAGTIREVDHQEAVINICRYAYGRSHRSDGDAAAGRAR